MTTFKEYKDSIFHREIEEIVINKEVNIRGKEILILGFIKDMDSNKLWTVEEAIKNESGDVDKVDIKTNRDDYRMRIATNSQYEHIHFTQMKIQGKIINFTSSQSTSLEYANASQINTIRHFIECGLLTDKWNDVDIENIIFGIYEQSEDENFPSINMNDKIDITINIDESFTEVLIEQPLIVRIGKAKKDTKVYYIDADGVKDYFYLDEVIKYDLHKDTLDKINTNIEYIEEEQRQNYVDSMMDDISRICPKNKYITSIYYETEDNTQLVFYTKDKLESIPEDSNSCTSMLWLSEEKYGINGHNKYVDMICPVEKDFDGELEIELFSKYNKLPSQIISIEI